MPEPICGGAPPLVDLNHFQIRTKGEKLRLPPTHNLQVTPELFRKAELKWDPGGHGIYSAEFNVAA